MPQDSEFESERLKKAVGELTALNQIANAVNSLMTVEDISQVIVERCLKKTQSSQGAVFLLEEADKDKDKLKTFVREFSASSDNIPFHVNEGLTGWIIKNKTILLCNDPENDEQFSWLKLSRAGIKSILAAPLFSKSGLIGSIILFNKKEETGFTEEDKRFLGIVGSQTANVIENARLYEQEMAFTALKEEMKIAHSIQKKFLPPQGICLDKCQVCGINHPARDVSGDFFDIVKIDENRVFVSLGDVAGKGMPAALLMANAQAVLRSHLMSGGEINLDDLAFRLNNLICQFTDPEQYITLFLGLYDCTKGALTYINAGHEPPLILRPGKELEALMAVDMVVGVVPNIEFNAIELSMNKGESCIVFTDGITEAFNENDEQYGIERLYDIINKFDNPNPEEASELIVKEVNNFRGDAPQSDDITLLFLKAI